MSVKGEIFFARECLYVEECGVEVLVLGRMSVEGGWDCRRREGALAGGREGVSPAVDRRLATHKPACDSRQS